MSLQRKIIMMVGSLLLLSLLCISFSTLYVVDKDYTNILDQLLIDNVSATRDKASALSLAVTSTELERKFKLMINSQRDSFREIGYTPQIVVIKDEQKEGAKIYLQETTFSEAPQELINEALALKKGKISVTIESTKYVFFYDYSIETRWIYMLGIPESEYYQPIYSLRNLLAVISGVALVLVFSIANIASKSVSRPLDRLGAAVNQVEEGNLGVYVDSGGGPVTRKLSEDLNKMITRTREVIAGFRESSHSLNDKSQELFEYWEILAEKSLELQEAIIQVRQASAEQLEVTASTEKNVEDSFELIAGINGKVQNSAAGSELLIEKARNGQDILNELVSVSRDVDETIKYSNEKMKSLLDKSNKISKIVKTINNMADQTQLLSLNARIEAARAGKYGASFSVVADEVRKLSDEAKLAGNAIEKLIRETREEINLSYEGSIRTTEKANQSFELIGEINSAFNTILEEIDFNNKGIMEISKDSEEIGENFRNIQDSLVQVKKSALITEESIADIEQAGEKQKEVNQVAKDVVGELKNMADQLAASVNYYKI